MDYDILKCIFSNIAAEYAMKKAVGVNCGISLSDVALAYNYMKIADAYFNYECDITPDTQSDIIAFQNAQSLTIQTCC